VKDGEESKLYVLHYMESEGDGNPQREDNRIGKSEFYIFCIGAEDSGCHAGGGTYIQDAWKQNIVGYNIRT
jgi:hypothetical protein